MTLKLIAADYLNELLHPFATSERVPGWPHPYIRQHPALLDQLGNTETNSQTASDPVRATPASRPAGRLDVLVFLDRIDQQSHELAQTHELKRLPLRPRLSALSGVIGDSWNGSAFTSVKGWWVTARVLTSFDSPAFTPNVPCPNEGCDRRGSLRVKVAEPIEGSLAVCVECHHIWDGPNFGVFAMWVQWAGEHLHSSHRCDECVATHVAMGDRSLERASAAGKSRYASSRR